LTERLEKIATDKTDLRKKYNEGDIDFDEYEQQRDALDEQKRELEQTKLKADIAQDMRVDRWVNRDVAGFLADHAEYKPGSALHAMLDQEVRILQAQAEQEGKDPLDPAFLATAHANVRKSVAKDLGLDVSQLDKPTTEKKPTVPPQRDVPPTLGNLPAAEPESVDGGRWAALDRLADSDPSAYEEKLASMPDEERNAYLASQ